jgi:hypothetical protein
MTYMTALRLHELLFTGRYGDSLEAVQANGLETAVGIEAMSKILRWLHDDLSYPEDDYFSREGKFDLRRERAALIRARPHRMRNIPVRINTARVISPTRFPILCMIPHRNPVRASKTGLAQYSVFKKQTKHARPRRR